MHQARSYRFLVCSVTEWRAEVGELLQRQYMILNESQLIRHYTWSEYCLIPLFGYLAIQVQSYWSHIDIFVSNHIDSNRPQLVGCVHNDLGCR